MDKQPEVHTVPNGEDGWNIKQGGKTVDRAATKEEAMKLGKKEAKSDGTEHRIHNTDGKIAESDSYGNDPYPPKG